jgi:hypothetical protein
VKRYLIVAGIVVLAIAAFVRYGDNELARQDPPAACQVFGGSWSAWSGWTCG